MIYLDNLAGIYWDMGDRALSFKHAKEAVEMAFSVGNEIRAAEFLKRIVEMNLLDNNIESATLYFKKLESIAEHHKAMYVSQLYIISRALMLKFSPRGFQKYQSQTFFKELVMDQDLNSPLKNECRLHLMDLLLDELEHYPNDEVLNEIIELSSEIYESAQEHHAIPLAVGALILKAKIEIISSNFQVADNYLDQASVLAEERGYKHLLNEILKEQREMHNNFDEWEKLIRKGAPLRDRIKQSKLKEYLDQVISEHSL